jgi:hypothetical protein
MAFTCRLSQLERKQLTADIATRHGGLRVDCELRQIMQKRANGLQRIAVELVDYGVDFLICRLDGDSFSRFRQGSRPVL